MKTLLVLFCVIAFASAIYNPVWNQCGNSSDVFTPTSVTAQKDPKNETQTLISACGTVNSHGSFTVFNRLNIEIHDGVFAIVEYRTERRVVPSGSAFCLNHTEDFSMYTPRNIYVQMTAYNILGEEAGCVNMTLQVPVPESKLLFRGRKAI